MYLWIQTSFLKVRTSDLIMQSSLLVLLEKWMNRVSTRRLMGMQLPSLFCIWMIYYLYEMTLK